MFSAFDVQGRYFEFQLPVEPENKIVCYWLLYSKY